MDPDLFRKIYDHPALREPELTDVVAAHERVTFTKHELLLRQGCSSDEYYILQEGVVRAYVYDPEGNEITPEFFPAQTIVIEPTALFHRTTSRVNFQALTDCIAWKMDHQEFQRLFQLHPGVPEWGRAWMSQELFRLQQRFLDMLTLSATERYLNLVDNQPEIIARVPLKYIATYLGVTDSSLSRIRREISNGC